MSKTRQPQQFIAEIDSNGSQYLFKIAQDMQKMPDFEGDSLDYLASLVLSSIVDYWCKADITDLEYIMNACDEHSDVEIGTRIKNDLQDICKADINDFPDFYNTKLTLQQATQRLDPRSLSDYRFTDTEVALSREYFSIWMEFD
jgi:hypothetical protein